MKNVLLELTFSGSPTIHLEDFSDLLNLFDQLNNMALDLDERRYFRFTHLYDYSSRIYRPKTAAEISCFEKNNEWTMQIAFGSISAYWILMYLSDGVAKWNINSELLYLQSEKFMSDIPLLEERDCTLDKLRLSKNKPLLTFIMDRFERMEINLRQITIMNHPEYDTVLATLIQNSK